MIEDPRDCDRLPHSIYLASGYDNLSYYSLADLKEGRIDVSDLATGKLWSDIKTEIAQPNDNIEQ